MRYGQIVALGTGLPVRWTCSALNVSARGYYCWRRREPCRRERRDQQLLAQIRAAYKASDRTYGSPRITKDLRESGERVSEKRVARIMRENGLQAIQRRRFKVTTQSGHNYPVTPNVLDRRFEIDAPNRAWVADIT